MAARFASLQNGISRLDDGLETFKVETRGIERVQPGERIMNKRSNYVQAFLLWVSVNLVAVNITLGMLAPTTFELSFKDGALCAAFGSLLGSIPTAYVATWGPRSGNRTLIFARYVMGWWPSKLIVILNIIISIGYSLIDLVIAGQILSAVSVNGNLSVVVGIIITAIIAWLITTFGIRVFHIYQRYAVLPQLIALCILYGVSASKFDTKTLSNGDQATKIGNRISFFSLCLSAAITYAGDAADFFVYYPESTSPVLLFGASLLGLGLSFTFAILIGVGLASGINISSSFASAFERGQGNLLVAGFVDPLGNFGRFLAVIIALGLVSNIVAPTYSCGIDFQVLGRPAARIPRFLWNTLAVVIYTVCALAGRDHLSEIFTNFLALMGYWVAIWIAITVEEHLIFRRSGSRRWDWDAWDSPRNLPHGLAALTSFLVGWAGAILCMAQYWYIGPIAKLIGDHGADLGNYIGFSWALLVYPPLRWLELRRFGR